MTGGNRKAVQGIKIQDLYAGAASGSSVWEAVPAAWYGYSCICTGDFQGCSDLTKEIRGWAVVNEEDK